MSLLEDDDESGENKDIIPFELGPPEYDRLKRRSDFTVATKENEAFRGFTVPLWR